MKSSGEVSSEPLAELTNEQRAAKLIFLAGRHSQGNPSIEAQFLRQAVVCHPTWTPETVDMEQVDELYTGLLIELFDGGHHASVDHFKARTPEHADNAVSAFAGGIGWRRNTELAAKVNIDKLVPGLLNIDKHYLIKQGGRPQRVGHQAMRSYLCHYGLMSRPTGAWEYDGLYRAIRSHILTELHDDPTSWQSIEMREVARVHAAADPNPQSAHKLMSLIPFEAQGRNLFDDRTPLEYWTEPMIMFSEWLAFARMWREETPIEAES